MRDAVLIRVEEPSLLREPASLVDFHCALCGFSLADGALGCAVYAGRRSTPAQEALGRICLRCRDAGPEALRATIAELLPELSRAEIQYNQYLPEPVCLYLKQ